MPKASPLVDNDRQPHPIDLHVGGRVRLRRKFNGMSQEELAKSIDLTFQQVQKYERGSNRISASKLYEISKKLQAPVSYFFDGYAPVPDNDENFEQETAVNRFLATSEGVELAEAFPRISSAKHRRRIVDLVRALSEDGES